jgi:uncharacterized protein
VPTLAYLDTSALVKLYVAETGSEQVAALVDKLQGALTASVIAYPEARGVFARYLRQGNLSQTEHDDIVSAFNADWQGMNEIEVTPAVYRRAGDLLCAHDHLRAMDAIHLASAIEASQQMNVTFLSFDHALQAVSYGFAPIPGNPGTAPDSLLGQNSAAGHACPLPPPQNRTS